MRGWILGCVGGCFLISVVACKPRSLVPVEIVPPIDVPSELQYELEIYGRDGACPTVEEVLSGSLASSRVYSDSFASVGQSIGDLDFEGNLQFVALGRDSDCSIQVFGCQLVTQSSRQVRIELSPVAGVSMGCSPNEVCDGAGTCVDGGIMDAGMEDAGDEDAGLPILFRDHFTDPDSTNLFYHVPDEPVAGGGGTKWDRIGPPFVWIKANHVETGSAPLSTWYASDLSLETTDYMLSGTVLFGNTDASTALGLRARWVNPGWGSPPEAFYAARILADGTVELYHTEQLIHSCSVSIDAFVEYAVTFRVTGTDNPLLAVTWGPVASESPSQCSINYGMTPITNPERFGFELHTSASRSDVRFDDLIVYQLD